MKYLLPVAIVTPTIDSPKLMDAIDSVRKQSYKNYHHYVIYDGVKSVTRYRYIDPKLHYIELPMKTGKVGNQKFYGHRIYAAMSQLVNEDYVIWLDEDNWFEPNHVETLVNTIESHPSLDFSYSLRKIFSEDKQFLIEDNCESLGKWPIWCSNPDSLQYLIDTSSFCFKRSFISQYGHLWNSGWGGDRRFLALVSGVAKYRCTGEYTLCYRLDGNANSVNIEFFQHGNNSTDKTYGYDKPWRKKE